MLKNLRTSLRKAVPFGHRPEISAAGQSDESQDPSAGPSVSLIVFQPLCGGCGSSTLAVTYAREIARSFPKLGILVMDLNVQSGSLANYLGSSDSPRVTDAYARLSSIDQDFFNACVQKVEANLNVFSAPDEIIPTDLLKSASVSRLIELARSSYDIIITELPAAFTEWGSEVWHWADQTFAVGLQNVRTSAAVRKIRNLALDGQFPASFNFLINQVPATKSAIWRDEHAAFLKVLGSKIPRLMRDGGEEVRLCTESGKDLHQYAPNNPLLSDVRDHIKNISLQLIR